MTALPRWALVAAVGGGLVVLTVLVPHGRVASVVYVAVALTAAAMIAVAVRRFGLPRRGAWLLLALGVVASALGDGAWYLLEFRELDPFPSIADAFYLGAYPLIGLALWRFTSRVGAARGALHDALIVVAAGTVVGWVFLLAPYAEDATLSTAERAFSLAYPVADLVLLLLLARLLFDQAARMPVHLILLVGVALWLVADITFSLGTLGGWYEGGQALDSVWLTAYICFATASWHPSAEIEPVHASLGRVEHTVAARSAMLSQGRLAILAFASLLAPVVILVYGGRDPTTVRVAATGAIVLGLLVLHRMAGLTARIAELVTDLDHASNTDPLTGTANRRQLDQRLANELARVERTEGTLSLALLDLDHFKRFNDTYGHQAGDTLLRELVARWNQELHGSDLLARYGGEEFVVLLPDCRPNDAEVAVERLRARVPFGEQCSAGLAHREPGESAESLILRADLALYEAKRGGRDRTVVACPTGSDGRGSEGSDHHQTAGQPEPAAG